MTERHLRKFPNSLVIREMKIKTNLRFPLTSVTIGKIKTLMTTQAGEDVELRKRCSIAGGVTN